MATQTDRETQQITGCAFVKTTVSEISMGSQHPLPNVKTLCSFKTRIWLEIITSRDAESAYFKVRGRHVERERGEREFLAFLGKF